MINHFHAPPPPPPPPHPKYQEKLKERRMEFILFTRGAAAENGSLKNDHTQLPGSLLRRTHETDLEINLSPNSDWHLFSQGSDTIVGSLDSGIWPESESFNAKDMSPIPSRWKGACAKAHDLFHLKFEYKTSKMYTYIIFSLQLLLILNRKVNGSRSYIDPDDIADGLSNTPSDTMGHGTHVASTASGTMVPGGSYYGLAIRAFHAVENGITVVCSAGNEGPTKGNGYQCCTLDFNRCCYNN
ncbi:hypothetical protein OIU84_013837 [Salix udensis]|uniref:Peptidase S8/S53 domain-containing protein n=1 Tax=Salix udensis TaxID=889485 RepID=A0AAD6JIW6_9ROSI|nr:hypothetical protein OIU84_013837 [Salix udensis]